MVQKRQKIHWIQTRNEVYREEQVSALIACNGKTLVHFFVQLCRQSNNFKVFSAFESIKAFDNIFGNNCFLMNTMLLKFQISGCKMDLTCSVGYV